MWVQIPLEARVFNGYILVRMITFDEFRNDVMRAASARPRDWRFGQAVFNHIEWEYGVARYVQFKIGVDCFYNDDAVDSFIEHSYETLCKFSEAE